MTATAERAETHHPLFEQHRETLEHAGAAIQQRGYWSAYPEMPSPSAYGGGAADEGRAAFEAHRGKLFGLDQPGTDGETGGERSPFGFDLDIRYPHADADALLPAMEAAIPAWRDAGPETRAGVCVEILTR